MKKKIWIPLVITVLLLAVLFAPVPRGVMKDGGTREWTALTYKIVDWNRISNNGTYERTRVYFGEDRLKSIDELWALEWERIEHSFNGTVLEMNGDFVLVEPVVGESLLQSCDKISFSAKDMDIGAKVGDTVKVTYVGGIAETYPAQVNAVKWEISKDLRHTAYAGQWLSRDTAERLTEPSSFHLAITQIYSDCFFAEHIIPGPNTMKVNGALSDEWCVGDQVLITCEDFYYDDLHRQECDMVSIAPSDFTPQPDLCYKPVIYLYPQQETEVSVRLTLDGRLTCTYPAYENGWAVTAAPDGTLTDKQGQTYNYLYWEGETAADWDMETGFCVKGEDTAAFLEDALAKLGLNRREANEFIVYWLPLMQENEYNIISFQTEVYTDAAQLDIQPAPDTLIRVFMAYKASDEAVEIPLQTLTAPERTGFTAVEWGGTEVE